MVRGSISSYVLEQAHVRCIKIWTGDRADNARAASYSADDLMTVERDIGRLAKYTFDMGGAGDLLSLSLSLNVPPWEDLHELSREELRLTNLLTTDMVAQSGSPTQRWSSRRPNRCGIASRAVPLRSPTAPQELSSHAEGGGPARGWGAGAPQAKALQVATQRRWHGTGRVVATILGCLRSIAMPLMEKVGLSALGFRGCLFRRAQLSPDRRSWRGLGPPLTVRELDSGPFAT